MPDPDLNYLDKKSMYIGLYKTPNKVLSCLDKRGREGGGSGHRNPEIRWKGWSPKNVLGLVLK